jgi:hypothetical protein
VYGRYTLHPVGLVVHDGVICVIDAIGVALVSRRASKLVLVAFQTRDSHIPQHEISGYTVRAAVFLVCSHISLLTCSLSLSCKGGLVIRGDVLLTETYLLVRKDSRLDHTLPFVVPAYDGWNGGPYASPLSL